MTIRACGHLAQSWDGGNCYICQRNARDRGRRPQGTASRPTAIPTPARAAGTTEIAPTDQATTKSEYDDHPPPAPASLTREPAQTFAALFMRYVDATIGAELPDGNGWRTGVLRVASTDVICLQLDPRYLTYVPTVAVSSAVEVASGVRVGGDIVHLLLRFSTVPVRVDFGS
jgi:hypothetical protein